MCVAFQQDVLILTLALVYPWSLLDLGDLLWTLDHLALPWGCIPGPRDPHGCPTIVDPLSGQALELRLFLPIETISQVHPLVR